MNEIYLRRSVRKYKDDQVNIQIIKNIIKAGMNAPSAHNQQPWQFMIVDDKELLLEMRKNHPYAVALETSPACILVLGDKTKFKTEDFWVQDVSAATQNIMLAAKSKGLDTCWHGLYPINKVMDPIISQFGLPAHIIPFCMISLGYADESKKVNDRYKDEDIHINKF